MPKYDNSMLQCFRSECERKFFYRYIHHLVNVRAEAALTYGTALHKAFDVFFEGGSAEKAKEEFGRVCAEDLDTKRTVHLAHRIIDGYYKEWEHQPIDEVLGVEKRISTQIGRVEYWAVLDKMVRWHFGVSSLDHKTTSSWLAQFMRTIDVAYQFTGHAAIMRDMFEDASGVIVDAVHIPKPLKTKEAALDFQRATTFRSEWQISEWMKWVLKTADLIDKAGEEGEWQKAGGGACYGYNRECPYKVLCDLEGASAEDAVEEAKRLEDFVVKKWEPWAVEEVGDGGF